MGFILFLYERAKARYAHKNVESWMKHLASSVEAGVLCVLLTNPIWLIKTRLALQQTPRVAGGREVSIKVAGVAPENNQPTRSRSGLTKPYRGAFDAARSILKQEGILGLYKGVGPALVLVSHGVAQFCVYEELKDFAMTRKRDDGGRSLTPIESACMGAASKLIATTTTYPIQVVKARVQQRQQDPKVTPRALRKSLAMLSKRRH